MTITTTTLRQGKAGLLVPWMVVTFLSLVYDLVAGLIKMTDTTVKNIITIIIQRFFNQVQIIATVVRLEALGAVFGVIGFGVGCYLFVVVWSFRSLSLRLRQFFLHLWSIIIFRKQLLEVNLENQKA